MFLQTFLYVLGTELKFMNLPNMIEAKKRDKKEFNVYNYEDVKCVLKNKKYFIRTYGCQMNEHDTEKIKGILESNGFVACENYVDADVVIINTCAIRENAHNKVFGFLGQLKHLKETKKDLIIGICGCMPQEESVANEIKDKYKFVNFVFGTHNIEDVIKLINESVTSGKQSIEVFSKYGDVCEGFPFKRST